MRLWAEIKDSIIRGIHKMPDNLVPEFNPNSWLHVVEITGMNPMPEEGWLYDEQDGTFSAPPVVPAIPTKEDKAKDILKSINITNLIATDEGIALKAILQALDLI